MTPDGVKALLAKAVNPAATEAEARSAAVEALRHGQKLGWSFGPHNTRSETLAYGGLFAGGMVVGGFAVIVVELLLRRHERSAPPIGPDPVPTAPPPAPTPPAPTPEPIEILPEGYVARQDDNPQKIAIAYHARRRPDWWLELQRANPHKPMTQRLGGTQWVSLRVGEVVNIPATWGS